MAKSLLVIHGPNLDLLGTREPEIYGRLTLADIDGDLRRICDDHEAILRTCQSNHEGVLVDRVHEAAVDGTDFIVINPAAFTHTSVALRDALAGVAIPFIEVHLSNVYRREPFRHHSFFSDLAVGLVCGLGVAGYRSAVRYALDFS